MLQSQVQTSEALLQDLQKTFSQSQNAVQSRLVSDVMSILQSVCDCVRDGHPPSRKEFGKYTSLPPAES